MQKTRRHAVSTLFFIGLLSACASPAPTQRLPEITFSHLPVFEVDVARIETENRYIAPLSAPHIEHLMPSTPATTLERWLKDRFKPVGLTGSLRLVIEDARATKTALTLDKSLKGHLTRQQSQRYDMAVQATLQIRDETGKTIGTALARAQRSTTAREDISLNDREKLWFDTLNLLMTDFNQAIETNVRSYLSRWLH